VVIENKNQTDDVGPDPLRRVERRICDRLARPDAPDIAGTACQAPPAEKASSMASVKYAILFNFMWQSGPGREVKE
jgi:hypothetical protein